MNLYNIVDIFLCALECLARMKERMKEKMSYFSNNDWRILGAEVKLQSLKNTDLFSDLSIELIPILLDFNSKSVLTFDLHSCLRIDSNIIFMHI